VTRLGNRHRAESVIRTEDPVVSRSTDWSPRQPAGCGRGNGLCRHRAGLCLHHSLTIDMTAYGSLSTLGAWLDLQG
jgi:5'-nucleotidase